MTDYAALERALGYSFENRQLLTRALTHRSAGRKNNERLEFLGDSILNHVIAETLYRRHPDAREGELSRMRAHLVKGDTLADLARELGLSEHLLLGPGERKGGGHRRSSILADTLEAIAGAILLDNGVEPCRATLLQWFGSRLERLAEDAGRPADEASGRSSSADFKDPKTRLQEYLQGRGSALPVYELLSVSGAEHDRIFNVTCRIDNPALRAEGAGKSRRKAEQAAAEELLRRLPGDRR